MLFTSRGPGLGIEEQMAALDNVALGTALVVMSNPWRAGLSAAAPGSVLSPSPHVTEARKSKPCSTEVFL